MIGSPENGHLKNTDVFYGKPSFVEWMATKIPSLFLISLYRFFTVCPATFTLGKGPFKKTTRSNISALYIPGSN